MKKALRRSVRPAPFCYSASDGASGPQDSKFARLKTTLCKVHVSPQAAYKISGGTGTGLDKKHRRFQIRSSRFHFCRPGKSSFTMGKRLFPHPPSARLVVQWHNNGTLARCRCSSTIRDLSARKFPDTVQRHPVLDVIVTSDGGNRKPRKVCFQTWPINTRRNERTNCLFMSWMAPSSPILQKTAADLNQRCSHCSVAAKSRSNDAFRTRFCPRQRKRRHTDSPAR